MVKNIHIIGKYHHKNEYFLKYFSNKYFNIVDNINKADIIFSANVYINIEKYPNKIFIFGPHFSVFPNNIVKKFNNINKNAIYIQPSQQSVNTWQNEFNFNNLPMKAIPFGVDTNKFKPNENDIRSDEILFYYKDRNPSEFSYIKNYLDKNKIKYKVFDYKKKYNNEDYCKFLKKCKFGIWLGCHESQGFALNEALSSNVPLLVWNVILRIQQWSQRINYKNVKSQVTTIPYWDNRCGEYFYKKEDFDEKFKKMVLNLNKYKPREYILDNLSYKKCSERFLDLINSIHTL